MSNYFPVHVDPPAIYRGGTPAGTQTIQGQSIDCNWAWGSEPASASMIYLSGAVPVTAGDQLTILCAGHTFYGVCKSDTDKFGSNGSLRELTFVDSREYLDWDLVYGCFNRPDNRIVSGRRIRRWRHLLPDNYNAWRWTFTNAPYTAEEILNFIFDAVTVEDPWVRTYHADQVNYAIQEVDCTSGTKLKSVLQDISDRQGLTFTLKQTGRYDLLWARKGEGSLPSFPSDSDNRELGASLSGHPTRMRIIGERNVYQVHNITMLKDWAAAWEAFYSRELFEEDVFLYGNTTHGGSITNSDGSVYSYAVGTPFATIAASGSDPEGYVARQLAGARAANITVGEYSNWSGRSGFADTRKWSGRSRMDMPCYTYIDHILFRAFQLPSNFTFKNGDGYYINADSCKITSQMVALVSHDPVTGVMSWDTGQNPDGTGYAIMKGYQLGQDMFRTIKPENFNLSAWTNSTEVWQHIPFTVDEAGDSAEDQFILFDEPAIYSSDLIEMQDGYAYFKAQPTFTCPLVKATLCFEAEKFSYVQGTGTRDEREMVGSLYAEHVQQWLGTPSQIPFADGESAADKAETIATALLNRQFSYANGGFKRHIVPTSPGVFATGTQLTGVIDRVSLNFGPGGISETIGFTNELPRQFYVPVRDLERQTLQRELLPGQAELRAQSNAMRMFAMGMSQDPRTRKTITDAMKDAFSLPAQGAVRVKTV